MDEAASGEGVEIALLVDPLCAVRASTRAHVGPRRPPGRRGSHRSRRCRRRTGTAPPSTRSRPPSPRRGEQGLPRPALPERACGLGRARRSRRDRHRRSAPRSRRPGRRPWRQLRSQLQPRDGKRAGSTSSHAQECRLVRSRAAARRARASRPPGLPHPGRRGSCRSRSRHAPRAASRLARDTGGGHARGSPIASSSRPSINVAVVNSSRSSASRGVSSSARENASYASSHVLPA